MLRVLLRVLLLLPSAPPPPHLRPGPVRLQVLVVEEGFLVSQLLAVGLPGATAERPIG